MGKKMQIKNSNLITKNSSKIIDSSVIVFIDITQKKIEYHISSRNVSCLTVKVTGILKLALDAGKANPSPPVGPALGAKGVNIMAFCKEYNAKTADKIGSVIPVEITLYEDKSFSIKLKTSPASILIKKASGIDKGSSNPKQQLVGSLSKEQVKEIAVSKIVDLNCTSTESAIRTVLGTCEGMGVKVDA